MNDFGFDSIQIVQTMIDLESEFNILIDDEDIVNILTCYKPLTDLIIKKLNADRVKLDEC